MSEYQYYEFLAIDRPLTQEEQEAVAWLSSRVDPHPRRAVFTYSWSDFPGRAEDVLARYYDAMLYMASWGAKQLMFRFPKGVLQRVQIQPYLQPRYVEEYVSLTPVGEHVVLDVKFYEEGGYWVEAEAQLDTLTPLRDDILRGDYRALYLAWLKTLEVEDVLETVPEPPVPPGLGSLTPALEALVELFEIDEMLVQVAAEASGERSPVSDAWIERALARLPEEESKGFLSRLARGEPYLSTVLLARLRELAGQPSGASSPGVRRRSVGELLSEAERREREEQQRRAEAEERKRLQEPEALAAREAEAWQEVDALIQRGTASAYDEAVRLLLRLGELAIHRNERPAFERRVSQLYGQYSRRSALLRRLGEAGLYPL